MESKNFKTGKVWNLGIFISIGYFVAGYNQGVFNTSMNAIGATLGWGDNQYLFGALFSAFNLIGSAIGGLLAGFLANKIGRKNSLIVNSIFGLFGTGVSMIPNTITFGIGRLMLGVVSGVYLHLCPLYFSETIPKQVLGKIGALCQVNFSVGVTCSFAIGLPLPTDNLDDNPMSYWWIAMFGIQIPLFFFLLAMMCFKYNFQTPYWSVVKKHHNTAKIALQFLYFQEQQKEILQEMNSEALLDLTVQEEHISTLKVSDMCCSKKYFRLMRLACLAGSLVAWTGLVTVVFYSTLILSSLGGGEFMSRVYSIIIGFILVVGVFPSIALIEKLGRKKLMVWNMFFIAGMLGCLALVIFLEIGGVFLPLAIILLIILSFQAGPGPINWLYCGEIGNDQTMGISIICTTSSLTVITLTFPFILEAGGAELAYLIYCIVTVCSAVYFSLDFVETKGLTKNEIYKLLVKN